MSSFPLRAISAAAMWGVTAMHASATPKIMGPTNASALSTELKGFHWLCWHGVTSFMIASSLVFSLPFLGFKQPDQLAVFFSSAPWMIMSVAALGKSIQLGKPGLYALQYTALFIVPALALASTFM